MELNDLLTDIETQVTAIQGTLAAIRGIERNNAPLYVDVLYTRKEAAFFLGRTVRTVDRLCSEHRIHRLLTDDGIRIRKSELLAYKGYELKEKDTRFPDGNVSESESDLDRLRNKYL